jgi:hypothetical protein
MNPKGGPEEHRFTPDRQPANPGRTPTKWIRERLSRAAKSGDCSERESIYEHLLEVATSWEVRVIGRDSEGELLKVASARDAVAAAKLLFEYDMGKPVNSVEVSNPDGSLAGASLTGKTTSELREAIAKAIRAPAAIPTAPTQEPAPQEEKAPDAASASGSGSGSAE